MRGCSGIFVPLIYHVRRAYLLCLDSESITFSMEWNVSITDPGEISLLIKATVAPSILRVLAQVVLLQP